MNVFDRDIQRLAREFQRSDQDPSHIVPEETWTKLALHASRTGNQPDFLTKAKHLKPLLKWVGSEDQDPIWSQMVLHVLQCREETSMRAIPACWSGATKRGPLGCPVDSLSGLPLWVRRNQDNALMVLIRPGEHRSHRPDEGPLSLGPVTRQVFGHYVDVYPVTASQYGHYLAQTGARPPLYWRTQSESPERPVVFVDFDEICRYGTWAGARPLREAEWEKAANAGISTYPWGEDPPDPAFSNFLSAPERRDPRAWDTFLTPVDAHPKGASSWGVWDLLGNTCEWTLADTAPFPPPEIPRRGPEALRSTPKLNLGCVVRGASWIHGEPQVHRTARRLLGALTKEGYLGFRLALEVEAWS